VPAHFGGAQALIAAAGEGDSHRAYLALFNHIQERDRLIADGFDNWSRSRAIEHLVIWRGHNLITDDEFAAFSKQLQPRTWRVSLAFPLALCAIC
jgi:hypothetical protein